MLGIVSSDTSGRRVLLSYGIVLSEGHLQIDTEHDIVSFIFQNDTRKQYSLLSRHVCILVKEAESVMVNVRSTMPHARHMAKTRSVR